MGRKTKSDPNGQRGAVRNATAKIRKRLKRAQLRVLAEFNQIPRKVMNAKDKFYTYDYDLNYLWLLLTDILNSELGVQFETIPLNWWYKSLIEAPYRQGALDEVIEFNGLESVRTTINVQPILFSPEYTKGIRDIEVINYNLIKGLSQETSKQVFQVLSDGMSASLPANEIKKNIRERFNVSESRAKTIVRTEMNRAYTDARLNTVGQLSRQSGVDMGVVHLSALLPTTRKHHANRNAKVYTVEQQKKWWNSGSNRVNCYCSVRTVVFDENGEIADPLQRQRYKDSRLSDDD